MHAAYSIHTLSHQFKYHAYQATSIHTFIIHVLFLHHSNSCTHTCLHPFISACILSCLSMRMWKYFDMYLRYFDMYLRCLQICKCIFLFSWILTSASTFQCCCTSSFVNDIAQLFYIAGHSQLFYMAGHSHVGFITFKHTCIQNIILVWRVHTCAGIIRFCGACSLVGVIVRVVFHTPFVTLHILFLHTYHTFTALYVENF